MKVWTAMIVETELNRFPHVSKFPFISTIPYPTLFLFQIMFPFPCHSVLFLKQTLQHLPSADYFDLDDSHA